MAGLPIAEDALGADAGSEPRGNMMSVAVIGRFSASAIASTWGCLMAGIRPSRFHAATFDAGSPRILAIGLMPPNKVNMVVSCVMNSDVQNI